MYIICWKIKSTGITGKGEPTLYLVAKSWIEFLNKIHPDIEHWIEKAD